MNFSVDCSDLCGFNNLLLADQSFKLHKLDGETSIQSFSFSVVSHTQKQLKSEIAEKGSVLEVTVQGIMETPLYSPDRKHYPKC